MANHGPAYGDLAQTLQKRDALYDRELEKVIQTWIEQKLNLKFPGDFATSLKDGVILCNLINACSPGVCKNPKASKMPFVQMENISNFCTACKSVGLSVCCSSGDSVSHSKEVDIFVTVDLYESKNLLQVQHCLDKLRIRFGGQQISVSAVGGDVFNVDVDTGSQIKSPRTLEAESSAPKFCASCGEKNAGGKFCAGCGGKF